MFLLKTGKVVRLGVVGLGRWGTPEFHTAAQYMVQTFNHTYTIKVHTHVYNCNDNVQHINGLFSLFLSIASA